jgi:glutamyl-tRNA synthetase
VNGRYAPSPTGALHLGNLRTALLAWLFARSAGSRFAMRVDDLDAGRVRPGLAEAQLADLEAIGLDWDPPVVWQSARSAAYEEAIGRWTRRACSTPASARAARSARRPPPRTARCPRAHIPAPAAS